MARRTQTKPVQTYRYSERGLLTTGDTFRVRGGPRYNGVRTGYRGLYRLLGVEVYGNRTYLLGIPVDKHNLPIGGTALIYVSGEKYALSGLKDWLVQPYKISKKRVQ